jgi:hypothetical protein
VFERKSKRTNNFKAEAFSVVVAMTDSRTPVRMTWNTSANFNYIRKDVGPIRMVRIITNKLMITKRHLKATSQSVNPEGHYIMAIGNPRQTRWNCPPFLTPL